MSIQSLTNRSQDGSSLPLQSQREIKGAELIAKSVVALTIGIIPFIGAKIGEAMVKGCAHVEDAWKNHLIAQFPTFSVVSLEIFTRGIIGIPALLGSALLTGGAIAFSKTQALVWGQELVEHPQEERINTKLARYGAGNKPLNDLKDVFSTFFYVFGNPERFGPSETFYIRNGETNYLRFVNISLEKWKNFEAT